MSTLVSTFEIRLQHFCKNRTYGLAVFQTKISYRWQRFKINHWYLDNNSKTVKSQVHSLHFCNRKKWQLCITVLQRA